MSTPRFPHLVGKGIMYGAQASKHHELVKGLWALVTKLDREWLPGEDVLDPRDDIADEIEKLLRAAGEEPPNVQERTQK